MQKKKPARERTRAPKKKSDIERRLDALELLVQKQGQDLHNMAHNVAVQLCQHGVDREKLQVRMEHFAAEIKVRLYALGEDIPKLVSQQDERIANLAKSVVDTGKRLDVLEVVLEAKIERVAKELGRANVAVADINNRLSFEERAELEERAIRRPVEKEPEP